MSSYQRGIGTVDFNNLAMVVAFDPGETTGWCVMGILPGWLDGSIKSSQDLQNVISYINYGQIDCVASGGFDEVANQHLGISFGAEAVGVSKMASICWDLPDPAIVIEDFVVDFNKIDQARHTLSPVRIMSMFSYAMYIDNEQPFYSKIFIQGRSMAKTTCTDARLKHWGLYDASGGRHARDATRHAYYFLRTARGNSQKAQEIRHRAWPDIFENPWSQKHIVDEKARRLAKGERVRFAK